MLDPDDASFEEQIADAIVQLLKVDTRSRGEWQSKTEGEDPRFQVRETLNATFGFVVPAGVDGLQQLVRPNLPWAEDHFAERVSGQPLNPGYHYLNWPWYKQGVEDHKPGGKFSHTYMERFWPRQASTWGADPMWGLRFEYGDLRDVVDLLRNRPGTRQAFLPVWFPEDTGAVHGERVPCTIGYHFQFLGNALFCTYFMRSCDIVRYLRDDAYLAARLVQWILAQLGDPGLVPGWLVMNIANLHCFEGDVVKLRRELNEQKDEVHGA